MCTLRLLPPRCVTRFVDCSLGVAAAVASALAPAQANSEALHVMLEGHSAIASAGFFVQVIESGTSELVQEHRERDLAGVYRDQGGASCILEVRSS